MPTTVSNDKEDNKPLFTGASTTRITPDLKELRRRFAEEQEAAALKAAARKKKKNGGVAEEEEVVAAAGPKESSRVVEKSAKRKPVFHSTNVVEDLVKKNRPASTRKGQDPRFGDAYGTFDKTFFDGQYKFVTDQQEEEQKKRGFRLKKLRVILRHRDLEKQGANLEEMGVIAEEQDIFEGAEIELGNMLRTPYAEIKYEMETLKAESATHKSRVAQAATALRAKEARKKVLKSEVDAVKSGKKAKPFIPSRSAFKAKVEEARYDHLVEKGGEQQAAKFIEKKRKKKQRME